MPGVTARSAKKGVSRLAKVRKAKNSAMSKAAGKGDLEGVEYAKVVKHLGDGRLSVLLSNNRSHIALIRGLLRRKGITPIAAGDIVILSSREYESRAEKAAAVFDVVSVMVKKDANALMKEGGIPAWMLASDASAAPTEGKKVEEEDATEFDYDGVKGDDDEDDDEEVDVDAV